MKLSEFAQKKTVRPRKKTPVFNLNNETAEKRLQQEIQSLKTRLEVADTELESLREIPPDYERIAAIAEKQTNEINTLKQDVEQHRELTRSAQEHVLQYDHLLSERDQLNDSIYQRATEVENKNKEIELLGDEISRQKNQYTELADASSRNSTKTNALKKQINEISNELETLKPLYVKVKNSEADLSIKYIEALTELNPLRHDYQFILNDNQAARAKIEQAELVKIQLESWIATLHKESSDSDSKVSAFEQTVENSKSVMLDMSTQIQASMEERGQLVERIHFLTQELLKPKMLNETAMLRIARLPTGAEAIHRQYIGHGKPTLLKFKIKEEEDDDF